MEITLSEAQLKYPQIRPKILESLYRYGVRRVPTGDFLYAVLSNDLKEAFARADVGNQESMLSIVQFCYNVLPASCWGSPEKVKQWLEGKGMRAK